MLVLHPSYTPKKTFRKRHTKRTSQKKEIARPHKWPVILVFFSIKNITNVTKIC